MLGLILVLRSIVNSLQAFYMFNASIWLHDDGDDGI